MKWRQFVTDYLSFSKKDRIGILAVLAITLVVAFGPILFDKKKTFSIQETKEFSRAIDTFNTKQTHELENDEKEIAYEYEPAIPNNSSQRRKLFQFDPNSLSTNGWKKLGLSEKVIHTIDKYRTKGGKFYKPEDLQKIWGMPGDFYESVKDYVVIPEIKPETNNSSPRFAVYSRPEKKTWNIEINRADTASLIELPGIGSKLASRVINFRDRLGGFYSVEQLSETYGLADSVFQKIKTYLYTNGEVKKINVNNATKDELKMDPYIKWNLANAIIEYRTQHGPFKTLDDLKNIAVIDDATFKRIVHYLSL